MLRLVRLLALPAGLLALTGCAGSTTPPDAPAGASTGSAPPASAADPGPSATPVAMGTVRPPEGGATRILDDHALTNRDCDNLGHQYGDVAKADQMAGLSPKLSAKQRGQAEASIDKVINKLAEDWIENCQNNLVGKNVDPATIKCALATKTVKAFDVCLNGEKK